MLPDRVSLHALLDADGEGPNRDAEFDPVEVIATADVVLGEDVAAPSRRFVVHGEGLLDRLTAGAVDGKVNVAGVRIVWVEIDIDTDEYDRLIAVVTAIKRTAGTPLPPDDDPPE